MLLPVLAAALRRPPQPASLVWSVFVSGLAFFLASYHGTHAHSTLPPRARACFEHNIDSLPLDVCSSVLCSYSFAETLVPYSAREGYHVRCGAVTAAVGVLPWLCVLVLRRGAVQVLTCRSLMCWMLDVLGLLSPWPMGSCSRHPHSLATSPVSPCVFSVLLVPSMYPLLFKDGLAIPYFVCQLAIVVGVWPSYHRLASLATVRVWVFLLEGGAV